MPDNKNWLRDVASGDDLPVVFSSPPDWLQALGAGTVTVVCDDGTTATLTVSAGDVLPGPFRRCTAMTASAVRFGKGQRPPSSTSSAAGSGSLVVFPWTGAGAETDLVGKTITLPSTPLDWSKVEFTLRGIRYYYPTDFTGAAGVLTWTESREAAIASGDYGDVRYFV